MTDTQTEIAVADDGVVVDDGVMADDGVVVDDGVVADNGIENDIIIIAREDLDESSELDLPVGSPDSFWGIFKTLSYLGIPRALSFTFSIEMIIVLWLLESLGSDEIELTAASWAILLINAMVTMGLSPLYALNPILNTLLGEIDASEDDATKKSLRDKFSKMVKQAYVIGSALLPFALIPLFFSGILLEDVLDQNEDVAAGTEEFTRYFAPALLALDVRLVSEEVLYAFEQQKFAAAAGLTNLSIGMGAGWYLAKYQNMGPRGIALGCVIESYLTAISFLLRIGLHSDFKDYRFFTDWKDLHKHYKYGLEILRIGGTIFFTNFSEFILPFAGGLFASWSGLSSGAVWNLVMQLIGITGFLRYALAFSECKEVSAAMGAHNYNRAKQLGIHGLTTTLAYTVPPALALTAWHELADAGSPEFQTHVKFVVPMACVGVLADVVRFHCLQYCRGIDDNLVSSIISSATLITGASAAYLTGIVLDYDVEGIVTTFTLTYSVAALLLAARGIYVSRYRLEDHQDQQNQLSHSVDLGHNEDSSCSWSPRFFQCLLPNNQIPEDDLAPANTI